MNGLNHEFMNNPAAFLRNHVVTFKDNSDLGNEEKVEPSVDYFDLSYRTGKAGGVQRDNPRYSEDRDAGYSNVAFVCGYWDANNQRWQILAQASTYRNVEGKLIVQDVRDV